MANEIGGIAIRQIQSQGTMRDIICKVCGGAFHWGMFNLIETLAFPDKKLKCNYMKTASLK